MAAREVNNAQPSHSKSELFANPCTLVVGPAVDNGRVHGAHDRRQSICIKAASYADNATHKFFFFTNRLNSGTRYISVPRVLDYGSGTNEILIRRQTPS